MSSIRKPLLFLVAAGVAIAGHLLRDAPAASAQGIRVSARTPAVALSTRPVVVRGRVRGGRAGIRLERAVEGRWVPVGRPRRTSGRFSLTWDPPRRGGAVRLRATARAGRRVAASRVMRVALTPTVVVPGSRVVEAPAAGVRGELRLAGRVPALRGGFVALDTGPAAPNGLLARVVAKRRDGAATVLDVEPASLVEAVPEGRLRVDGTALRVERRARIVAKRDFQAPIACSSGVGAEVRGSLAVTLDPLLEFHWARGRIISARAAAGLRGQAELAAEVGGRGSCELGQIPLARWQAPPLRAFVGPIPVVVTPRTTVYVSAKAQAKAAAHAELHGYLAARAAIRYDGGGVRTSGSFEQGFSYIEPVARASAAVGARLVPSVEFLLYGEIGPRFDLSAGLQFDADPAADPLWTLAAPVELSAGLSVPHFDGLTVSQRPVFARRFPLARAASADGAQAADDTPREGVTRARIRWDADATDVDLHVWNAAGAHASYEAPEAIAGGWLSSDDRDGFGPEVFADDGASGTGPLTVGVCYFDDHGRGPTAVEVEVVDTDGSTRRVTETLRSKGDGAIVASAGGFSPSGGWCTGAP